MYPRYTILPCSPWITRELKTLDRKRKREFLKHKKSLKWKKLNEDFSSKVASSKKNYHENIVNDLKCQTPVYGALK